MTDNEKLMISIDCFCGNTMQPKLSTIESNEVRITAIFCCHKCDREVRGTRVFFHQGDMMVNNVYSIKMNKIADRGEYDGFIVISPNEEEAVEMCEKYVHQEGFWENINNYDIEKIGVTEKGSRFVMASFYTG